jgi:hypothetical protein
MPGRTPDKWDTGQSLDKVDTGHRDQRRSQRIERSDPIHRIVGSRSNQAEQGARSATARTSFPQPKADIEAYEASTGSNGDLT